MSEEDWLDEQLLTDDVSRHGWKRRAVGMSTGDALMGMPIFGQTQIRMPIKQHRAYIIFCQERETSNAAYARRAVGAQLARDGYPSHLLEAWLE